MRGHECIYVCADDTHGTATMLRAEELGVTPEKLIEQVNAEHRSDFNDFLISHDNYDSTHSEENKVLSDQIYNRLVEAEQIKTRSVDQLYDPEKEMFLPDRFIKGECPKCKTEDQYGDNCEACGATYDATDLINPMSKLSGATPVLKQSTHFFLRSPNFTEFLTKWTRGGALQVQVANKLAEWLDAGLQDWDISRDAPYFGFEIPGAPGKYFYVWLDAPIGYMAAFQNTVKQTIWYLMTSGKRVQPVKSTTSSARTLSISTPCSGRPYWIQRDTEPLAECMHMALPPLMAEDVEITRHLYQRPNLSGSPGP